MQAYRPDQILCEQLAAEHGTPLFVIDCEQLRRQVSALQAALPETDLYYAVKALPHHSVLETFFHCGLGFDIASSGEIELLRSAHINPRSTIHTHPIKKDSEIRAALRFGCTSFVVDNEAELEKFRRYRSRVGLLLRVSFRNPDAVVDLSKKFGCAPEEVLPLIEKAEQLGIHIKGLSFHVGSQSNSSESHVAAIEHCNSLIRKANRIARNPMSLLDIGGGFPVPYQTGTTPIEPFCAPIRAALGQLPKEIRTIAEPGRFLVAPAAISIAAVVGKSVRDGRPWYYLDDGVYGNYSGMIYDHATYPIRTFNTGPVQSSVLTGPTCDSIDMIAEDIQLPALEIGDLVIGEMLGAYSYASATQFNSLPISKTLVLNEAKLERTLYYIA